MQLATHWLEFLRELDPYKATIKIEEVILVKPPDSFKQDQAATEAITAIIR
ncbi:MAG: hypothetical protein VKK42_24725 [Lyngbya sp.]|nr:hypothetical protein [Lyngbya sp.]